MRYFETLDSPEPLFIFALDLDGEVLLLTVVTMMLRLESRLFGFLKSIGSTMSWLKFCGSLMFAKNLPWCRPFCAATFAAAEVLRGKSDLVDWTCYLFSSGTCRLSLRGLGIAGLRWYPSPPLLFGMRRTTRTGSLCVLRWCPIAPGLS